MHTGRMIGRKKKWRRNRSRGEAKRETLENMRRIQGSITTEMTNIRGRREIQIWNPMITTDRKRYHSTSTT